MGPGVKGRASLPKVAFGHDPNTLGRDSAKALVLVSQLNLTQTIPLEAAGLRHSH